METMISSLSSCRVPAVIITIMLFASPSLSSPLAGNSLTKKDMDGRIIQSERKANLLTKGDKVELEVESRRVMLGDVMTIYKSLNKHKKWSDSSDALTAQGTIIITAINGSHIIGVIDSVKREISPDDFVRHQLPPAINKSRYFDFLKQVVSERLYRPAKDKISVAMMDITDEKGDVTVLTSKIFEELTAAVCTRPQFNCLPTEELRNYLSQYGIETSSGIGIEVRKNIAARFGLHQLLTANATIRDGDIRIAITVWDLTANFKTPETIFTASVDDFSNTTDTPFKVIRNSSKKEYGRLKVSLNVNSKISGRRVDHLFIQELSDYINAKYKQQFMKDYSQNIKLGNLSVKVNNKLYFPDGDNVIFNDLLIGEKQTITISASPVLKGKRRLIVGKPIENKISLNIPANRSINTEIFIKIDQNRAIMVVDSNPAN